MSNTYNAANRRIAIETAEYSQAQVNALINEAAGSAAAEALEAAMEAYVYAPQAGVAKLSTEEKRTLATLLNKATRLAAPERAS